MTRDLNPIGNNCPLVLVAYKSKAILIFLFNLSPRCVCKAKLIFARSIIDNFALRKQVPQQQQQQPTIHCTLLYQPINAQLFFSVPAPCVRSQAIDRRAMIDAGADDVSCVQIVQSCEVAFYWYPLPFCCRHTSPPEDASPLTDRRRTSTLVASTDIGVRPTARCSPVATASIAPPAW